MLNLILSLWRPVIEIGILWFVFYWILSFFSGTRAYQVFMGLLVLVFVLMLAQLFNLTTISWVLTRIFAFGVIFIPIIFQPEIRRALARLGQNTIFRNVMQEHLVIDDIAETCEQLAKNRIGAIIAIERQTGLKNYMESGVMLDSRLSSEQLRAIFWPGNPLHDGAVIVQGERIASAGCLFPLTQNVGVSKTMGTRHRAAIGLSEETDAVVIVVSEERGTVSVAVYGKLTKDLDADGLRRVLKGLLSQRALDHSRRNLFDLLRLRSMRTTKGEPAAEPDTTH